MLDRQAIDALYAEVLGQQTPDNEANTCAWIILPVLQLLGYKALDISSQGTNVAGNKPDYAILKSTPYLWFLEAKSWNVPLDATGAAQAVGYANERGRRWAVLTNGRKWQLFDNHMAQKPASERLVAESDYDQPTFDTILRAISKQAMVEDATQKVIRLGLLPSLLKAELSTPGSDVFQAVYLKLRSRVSGLTQQEMADAMAELMEPKSKHSEVSFTSSGLEESERPPNVPEDVGAQVQFTLDQAFDFRFTWKPRFEMGDLSISAENFLALTLGVFEAFLSKSMVFPEDETKAAGVYFTRNGVIASAKMTTPRSIGSGAACIWYEGHRAASNHVRMIKRVLVLNQLSPSSCRISAVRYKPLNT